VLPTVKHYDFPTPIWVIDDFFEDELALQMSNEFYSYDDERWLTRNNSEFEEKLLSTHWDWYPGVFYRTFFELASQDFTDALSDITGIKNLIADYGLHAGGMHLHASNGRLNLHQDAKIHPKLGLKRKLNIIIYLNKNWEESWGGELEFWDDLDGEPNQKIVSVSPKFNRAVLFQTDGDFWHGLPEMIAAPNGENRQSIAMFYYVNDEESIDLSTRAKFALTSEQKKDASLVAKNEERMRTAFKYGR
jgi:hypothetical protein